MATLRLAHPLLVRHARLDDAPALQAACYPEEALQRVAGYLHWCLAGPGRPVRLVALYRNRLAGHVELAYHQADGWAELSSLIVAPARRRRGIGRRLVGAALRLAGRWGCDEVRLQVQANASDLAAMYTRWGFRPYGSPRGGRRWMRHPLTAPPGTGGACVRTILPHRA